MDNTKAAHWVLGVALLMIGVFVVVALVMLSSQADDVTTSAVIENVAPSVDNFYVNDTQYELASDWATGNPITGILASGTTGEFHVNGIVSDTNGYEDIADVSVNFFRTAVTSDCTPDDNDCYKDGTSEGSCVMDTSYGDSTQAKFDCQFDLQYFIDSTDANSDSYSADTWTVEVVVLDDNEGEDEDSATYEMPTLLSLDIPSTLDFGTMGLGTATDNATNEEMTITQYGNDSADVEVSGTLLDCDTGTGEIPLANIEWDLADVGMDSGTDLTGSAVDTNLNVGVRTGASVTKTLYWNIQIPSTGVEGTCTGTTTVTTIAH